MKVIVTTTINSPTEATRRFAEKRGWSLLVVGDKRTPEHEYRGLNCEFFGYEKQELYSPLLSSLIGPGCIQRRNLGFLYAVKEMKATVVATVDDDNIPYESWGENLLIGGTDEPINIVSSGLEVTDPISAAGVEGFGFVGNLNKIWHRGVPLEMVVKRHSVFTKLAKATHNFEVQADFWDGDPDIDAVCRLTQPSEVKFPSFNPFCCAEWAPFNSQNTFLLASVIPRYFMHLDVGRWDDIVAGYVMQAHGYKVVYNKASVRQERNPHDVMEDFRKEVWGIENGMDLIRALKNSPSFLGGFLSKRAMLAYEEYQNLF